MSTAAFAKSDELKEYQWAFEQCPFLGDFFVAPVVIDANVVVNHLKRRVYASESPRTPIEECFDAGVLNLHAPRSLETEIYQSAIPKLSRRKQLDQDEMIKAWEKFRENIKFHDLAEDDLCRLENVTDSDDRFYVALEKKLAAAGTVSDDKHIREMNGTPLDYRKLQYLRLYARESAFVIKIYVQGGRAFYLTLNFLLFILRGFAELYKKYPEIFLMLGGFSIWIMFAFPEFRKWLFNILKEYPGEFVSKLAKNLESLGASVDQHRQSAIQAREKFLDFSSDEFALRTRRSD